MGRPINYRIVYDVKNEAGALVETFEEVAVTRPFQARGVTFTTQPAADGSTVPDGGSLTTVDRLYQVTGADLRQISGRQPGVGSQDQALGPVLGDAIGRGLARSLGTTRTVAGRTCGEYRVFEPIAGPLRPLAGNTNHDDLCLDGDGLVVREVWTLNGRVVLTKTAVEVDLSGDHLAERLSTANAGPVPDDLTAPTVKPMAALDAWLRAAPDPPAGFTQAAAVDFSFPDAQNPQAVAYSSHVWAFTHDADVISVEAGTGALPWVASAQTRPAGKVDGHPADSIVRADGAEVRADLGARHWVRVRGTVATAALQRYSESLRLLP